MSRKQTREERLKVTTLSNQMKYKDYEQNALHSKIIDGKKSAYESGLTVLLGLFEHHKEKNIEELRWEDVKAYVMETDKATTINNRVAYLNNVFGYFEEVGVKFPYFDYEKLNSLKVSGEKLENNKKNPQPLTWTQLFEVRKEFRKKGLYTSWLYFELVYLFGLNNNDEVAKFTGAEFNPQTLTFKLEDGERKANSIIAQIIEWGGAPKRKITGAAVFHHTKIWSELLDYRDINTRDVLATRENHFHKCSNCGNLYEAVPENWVVLEWLDNSFKIVVCKEKCSKEGIR